MTGGFSLLVFLLLALRDDLVADSLELGLSLVEGGGHASLEAVEDLGAGGGGLSEGLAGTLLLLGVGVGLGLGSLGSLVLSASLLVEGVESVHEDSVGQGVLLGGVGLDGGLGGAELGLDLVGVDDSSEVSAVHHVSVENVSTLFDVGSSPVSEDGVEGLEGLAGPDDESAEVTAGGELEEVKSVDVDEVDSGEVSGGPLDGLVLLSVDDQGALSEDVSGVSHLALADSNSLGLASLLEVLGGAEVLEGGEESLGGVDVEGVNNEGELGGTEDSVASGENQGGHGGGSNGSCDGVSSLVGVDLSVPSSVGLQGGEHSTLSALVAEGTLAGSGGTRATNTGDTCDGTTGSPGLSGVHHASLVVDSMSLSSVLVHVGVNELDDIVSDGGGEDGGKRD